MTINHPAAGFGGKLRKESEKGEIGEEREKEKKNSMNTVAY